jgi:hypothetical protein
VRLGPTSRRPVCALAACLLVLVPGIVRAAEPPCLAPQEFSSLATYALPNALSATSQRCSASLPADAFLKTGGPEMIARYAVGKPAAWPGAKSVFLKVTQSQQGDMVALLRNLPDQQLQQLVDAFIQGLVAEKIPAERCVSIDRMLRLLSPCPRKARQTSLALPLALVREPDRQGSERSRFAHHD